MASDLQRASGMWDKDGAKGRYMSGSTSVEIPAGAKLFLFRNDRKKNDRDPDWQLMFALPGEDQPPMRRAEPQRQQQRPERAPRGYDPATLRAFSITPEEAAAADEQIPF